MSVSSSLFASGGCEGSSSPSLSVARPDSNSEPVSHYTYDGKYYSYTNTLGNGTTPCSCCDPTCEDTSSEVHSLSLYALRVTKSTTTVNNIGAGRVLGLWCSRFAEKVDEVFDEVVIGVSMWYHRWQRRRAERAAEKQRRKCGREMGGKRRASV